MYSTVFDSLVRRLFEGAGAAQGARVRREPHVDGVGVPAARAHDVRGGRGRDGRAAREDCALLQGPDARSRPPDRTGALCGEGRHRRRRILFLSLCRIGRETMNCSAHRASRIDWLERDFSKQI